MGTVGPGEVPSVQRQLALPVVGLVALLLLIGATSAASVLVANQTLSSYTETLEPIKSANTDLLEDLATAEVALRTYELTRRPADLADFKAADRGISDHLATLQKGTAEVTELKAPVERQATALTAWREGYAAKVVALPPNRPPTPAPESSGELFRDARDATATVDTEIITVSADARTDARKLLTGLLVLVALIAVGGVVAAVVLAGKLSRELVDPLSNLVNVLRRLGAGDPAARAEVSGPQEVRDIASALNTLTEENLRGRDVEVDVLYRLEELDRVRNDLVSTVSHELRTPLTSIKGYLELLQDQLYDELSEMQLSMMGTIRRNLDRLTELISNLLALSRAEETSLSSEPLDLRGIATEVASDVRVTASGRDITVRTVLPAAPVILVGDRSQLLRAVVNLASNAVKFSRPGGTVELRVTQDGQDGVIEVVDEGIGIPAADLPGLGSRFYRASNAVKAEIAGTGLGLRIVQTILDRHEGTLVVESVEGEGTMAVIRLPLRRGTPLYPPRDLAAGA